MTKHEWKKAEKVLYLPTAEPTLITVPPLKYITIVGSGNPTDNPVFQEHIDMLYATSYRIRMMPRSGFIPPDYFEYTVYPLEGLWSGDAGKKSTFEYTLMIRQPPFVTQDVFARSLDAVRMKHPEFPLDHLSLETIEDGPSIQLLHIGSYDSESVDIDRMLEYLDAHDLQRRGNTHREIYLSDASRVAEQKLKTVLRLFIQSSS